MALTHSARQKPKDGVSIFDRKDPHPERFVKPDPAQAFLQQELDKSLKDSFPASDPPAISQASVSGSAKVETEAVETEENASDADIPDPAVEARQDDHDRQGHADRHGKV